MALLSFYQHRHRVSATQAEARDAALGVGALHLVEQRGQHTYRYLADRWPGVGAADWMR